jgi:uncharacterized phage-associated protein
MALTERDMLGEEDKFPALAGFKASKAAQQCAYFAAQERAGVEKLKLIKLIYLAEREFVSRHGHPMLYDELFSLPHGPICSSTLNGINGENNSDVWSSYIKRSGKVVTPTKSLARSDLDQVSDAEIDVLETIWKQFGHMTSSEIRRYTHDHCPEYTEIEKGRIPISYSELFVALGEQFPQEAEDEIRRFRKAEALLSA